MPTDRLTDSKVRAAKPRDKAYKVFDGNGLALWVSPAGAKVWRLYYRHAGKQQTMSFGAYPEVSLAEARKRRDEQRAKLRDGADPMAARRVRAKPGMTFKAACEAFWAGKNDVSAGYKANALRALEMHLWPTLGDRIVGSITREDLMEPLMTMDAAGHYVYVRKTRMWAGQVFEWAFHRGEVKVNPAALINSKHAFGHRKIKHFASVRQNEVAPLLQRLALEDEIQSVLACRFLAYTWVRTAEMRMMEWADLDGGLWRVPAAKMKKERDHLVPLPQQAVAILEKMKARCRGSKYVFPADHRLDRPMSENAVLYLLHRIGYKGKMTGHGWRSVASTWANERGYTPDAIERQIAHVPEDEVRATYNHAAYLPERTRMLQAWADWLDEIEAGSPEG